MLGIMTLTQNSVATTSQRMLVSFYYFVFDLPYIKFKEFYANVVLFIEVSLLISSIVF